MTKLYVREFVSLAGTEQSDSIDVPYEDGNAVDTVLTSTVAAAAVTFKGTTKWVYVTPDSICSIVISPTAAAVAATTSNFRLQAGIVYRFKIPAQQQNATNVAPATYQLSMIINT